MCSAQGNVTGTGTFNQNSFTKNLTAPPKPKQDEQGTYLPNGAAAKAGLNKSILECAVLAFVG